MYHEVNTPSGSNSIILADSSKEAKKEYVRLRGATRPSGYYFRFLQARKFAIDFPETTYRPHAADTDQMIGKDIILYDEHHGSSIRIRQDTAVPIRHFLDEYTTIIVL
jgi:hypothetical protein